MAKSREKRVERFVETFRGKGVGERFNGQGGVAVLFQKLVRLRAANDWGICQCISCGVYRHWKEMHGGHFVSRSKKSTAIDPMNVNPQCPNCNNPPDRGGLSGNHGEYRKALVASHGEKEVGALEARGREVRNWTLHELAEAKCDILDEIKHHLKRLGEK